MLAAGFDCKRGFRFGWEREALVALHSLLVNYLSNHTTSLHKNCVSDCRVRVKKKRARNYTKLQAEIQNFAIWRLYRVRRDA